MKPLYMSLPIKAVLSLLTALLAVSCSKNTNASLGNAVSFDPKNYAIVLNFRDTRTNSVESRSGNSGVSNFTTKKGDAIDVSVAVVYTPTSANSNPPSLTNHVRIKVDIIASGTHTQPDTVEITPSGSVITVLTQLPSTFDQAKSVLFLYSNNSNGFRLIFKQADSYNVHVTAYYNGTETIVLNNGGFYNPAYNGYFDYPYGGGFGGGFYDPYYYDPYYPMVEQVTSSRVVNTPISSITQPIVVSEPTTTMVK